jgi:hypothetical protein
MIIRRVEGLAREFKVTQIQAVIPNCLDKFMQPIINLCVLCGILVFR